ncbi:ABC transporter ATP-binding protein [Natronincola ferrireducens]|uniref:Oligopeptide transport system ATP-binding protein n=1 Tax=Natronincola ferrireducens TaxID=393762 RepID=A0A1G9F5D9_9FIRM|nr:ABC transporter ATP-binding protein [Natronincola ferrireducens]SDK83612.1 oligopeptide transport system ATP-binding protein [Natronincola ferrireducens]
MSHYFEIQNLKVNFNSYEGKKNILDIDHLAIEKGKTFGLVGESGSGKTVLALTILNLLSQPPGEIEAGKIIFNGENLLDKKESFMQRIRGKKISMIFQDPMSTLNPVFTIGEQLIRVIVHNQTIGRKAAEKKALEMIELVKLPDAKNMLKKYPHELSGGQRQRIIIAMALSCGAEFIIADEPTRNLDVTIQAGILKLIKELQRELQVTVLFIANNPTLIPAICDEVGILFEGKIVEKGGIKEVLHNPKHPYTIAMLNAIPKSKQEKGGVSHQR